MKKKCNHRNDLGSLIYEVEDMRCSTDRGTFGSICAFCVKCGEDITELVESERENYENGIIGVY